MIIPASCMCYLEELFQAVTHTLTYILWEAFFSPLLKTTKHTSVWSNTIRIGMGHYWGETFSS